ncbi:MAG: carbamoyltransferase HypF, partial [Anaerolineae bacterium]|nr:carbamoyltransferase HypF [Anaerolineae bacterium]
IQLSALWRAILDDLAAGVPGGSIALRFHHTVARMVVGMCRRMSEETGLKKVALSGGCFQNRLLLAKAREGLEETGLEVLTHQQVPCNDGGVSLGQAVIANRLAQAAQAGASP